MKPHVEAAYRDELEQSRKADEAGDAAAAWRHLERAHILSQRDALAHVSVHACMLAFGLKRGDTREVLGQIARIVVAAPGSWLGRAPVGNTGGARVGIFTPMAIPEDLRRVLDP